MTRVWVDFLMAATASLSGPSVRATMATSAPEAANRVATAKPIPLLPPVTMAVRPERLISIVFLEKARRDDRADFDFATPSGTASGTLRPAAFARTPAGRWLPRRRQLQDFGALFRCTTLRPIRSPRRRWTSSRTES